MPPTVVSPTLLALVSRIVPAETSDGDGRATRELAARVAERLDRMPTHIAAEWRLALAIFGSRPAAMLTMGAAIPFAAMSDTARDRMLEQWGTSRIPLCRTVFQGLRRLVLAVHYGRESVRSSVGYLGALHDRNAEVDWEGPAVGVQNDEEPIARTTPDARASYARAHAPGTSSRALRTASGVLDPDALVEGDTLSADVLVIGSGAGGAVTAARLAEAGLAVLIVESGDLLTADDFSEDEPVMTERLFADQGMRASIDQSLSMFQGGVVGGGTTVNWLIMLRTPDHVLDEWSTEHGVEGMSVSEMEPVFDQIEREVHARLVPDDAHSPNNQLILDGAAALGWRARAGRINAKGCVRSGFCGYGCRYDAKQGTLVTFIPRALAAGARLLPRAHVERIARTGTGRAGMKKASVAVRHASGAVHRITVSAPTVVVAAGAVETPAILQRSGLGGGGVGRFLRVHPTTAVVGFHGRPIHASAGIPLTTVCDEFSNRDGRGYGYWIECPPMHPMLASVATPGFGEAHANVMRRFVEMGVMIALVRDGADKDQSNGSVRIDSRGRPRVRYRLGLTDSRHFIEAMQAAARLQLASGAREVRTLHTRQRVVRSDADIAQLADLPHGPNDIGMFTAHVNGTCRIGRDRRTAAVNPDGERFGAPGIFVADGSLLPTALGVNPQETIMSVATVIAGRILALHRS